MSLWSWFKGLFRKAPRNRGDNKPLVSLVLLLSEPRYLDQMILTNLASRAFGRTIITPEGDGAADEFIVGETPMFVMRFEGDDFLINCFPVPYVNDVETTAADFPDLRMRKAFSQHRAWLSVDLLGERESKDLPKVYRRIGKLTAELADTDCLAIYSPATSQMMVYDATLEEGLRGDNPIELFNNPPLLPVVEVDGDEPEVAAAVAEAVERWPEFLSAFQNQRGELFNVKARVNDGKHVEYIWLSPTSIENGVIYGKLENDPVELRYKLGDRVRVQLSDLNDWVYKSGESLVGGFTIKAIQEIQSKKQR